MPFFVIRNYQEAYSDLMDLFLKFHLHFKANLYYLKVKSVLIF